MIFDISHVSNKKTTDECNVLVLLLKKSQDDHNRLFSLNQIYIKHHLPGSGDEHALGLSIRQETL